MTEHIHKILGGPTCKCCGPNFYQDSNHQVEQVLAAIERQKTMHYRNGREAKNGDKVVMLNGGKVEAFGVLHSATAGNDFCNGEIAVVQNPNKCACMCDCLHADDLAAILAEKGLDKRPAGK